MTASAAGRWAALRGIFRHPRGLAYLALTEAWERFSFFGMQTLLVLYMLGQLLQPGHVEGVLGFATFRSSLVQIFGVMTPLALASTIYGLYSGCAYLMPVLGGYLGDRVFGQHACVSAGALLMAAGHFLMAFDAPFLIALCTLVIGSGLLKGNISTQVTRLYAADDRRRADAFVIFNLGVNVGVVTAPLVCGTLGEVFGFHAGFTAAGVGMLIGLVIYHAGRRDLPPDRLAKAPAPIAMGPRGRRIISGLLLVLLVITSFLVAANQLGNIYLLWVKHNVDRGLFHIAIPVTWFAAFTAFPAMLLPPVVLGFWQRQASRGNEPPMLRKIALGCALCAGAFAYLAALAFAAGADGLVAWPWLVPFHLLIATAYLHVWPVGLALFTRAAPAAVTAMVAGTYFLSEFIAHVVAGRFGGLYEAVPAWLFWLLNAGPPAAGLLLLAACARRLERVFASHGDPA